MVRRITLLSPKGNSFTKPTCLHIRIWSGKEIYSYSKALSDVVCRTYGQ